MNWRDRSRRLSFVMLWKRTTGRVAGMKKLFWLMAFVGFSRAVLLLIGVASRLLIDPLRSEPYPWTYSSSVWLSIWGVWDTGWYLDIAVLGYSPVERAEAAIAAQANYAFFPLYPLLMRWVGRFLGGPFVAGIVISNVCLLISCVLLFFLVRESDDEDTAMRAVRFFVLFPTSFILSGVFSESLFITLVLAGFLLLRNGRFAAASAAGIGAALTRSVGAFLVVPLLVDYLSRCRRSAEAPKIAATWILLVPSGMAAFSWYNFRLTGDWLAFARIQSSWGRELRSPIAVLFGGIVSADVSSVFASLMSLVILLLLASALRKLELSYFIMSLAFLLVPLSTSLVSMPRYALSVFPVSILLARLSARREVESLLALALALLQGFLMVFWVNGFKIVV